MGVINLSVIHNRLHRGNYSAPPIENFSLIKHKLDFAYFLHPYKLFND